jgi:plasmid rolling circle replication initiator protein Rep
MNLANIKSSELHKSYWGSQYCNSRLYAENGRVTSQYCNSRWCITCNKIRMARLIEGYVTPLKNLKDKYFVTLTVPNCSAQDLHSVIRNMLSSCKAIMETMKRRKQRGVTSYQLVGIRKMECTYNSDRNDFHPHFHFIIQGESAAKDLLQEWLNRNPLCNKKAQDIKRADDNSIVELFKYFAKIIGKNKKGELGIHIQPLNAIFVLSFNLAWIWSSMRGYFFT